MQARAIEDPADRIAAEASAAVTLALTKDPDFQAQAAAVARQAVSEAPGIADLGERALALGHAAMAFAYLGETGLAADAAGECLRAVAASSPFGVGQGGAISALGALMDMGHITEALAGIRSLKTDSAKGSALRAVAGRLGEAFQTEYLLRLAQGNEINDQISKGHDRISTLTEIGRILAEAGETSVALAAGQTKPPGKGMNSPKTMSRQSRSPTRRNCSRCSVASKAQLIWRIKP